MVESTVEIVKKSISAVIAQGEQSIGSEGDCKYRSFNDCGDPVKCAVGHLISDEHYSEDLEGSIILNVKVKSAIEESIGFPLHWVMLEALRGVQLSHDVATNGPDFVKEFLELLWERGNESIDKALEELGYERKV